MKSKNKTLESSLAKSAEGLRQRLASLQIVGRPLTPAEKKQVRVFQKCVESIEDALELLRA